MLNFLFFTILNRRRSKKLQQLHSSLKSPLPMAGLPVNCCAPTPSPNGVVGVLQVYNSHKVIIQENRINEIDLKEKFRCLTESENRV